MNAGYIIPAKTYEKLMDLAEDIELGRIIEERKAEKADAVRDTIYKILKKHKSR